MFRRLSIQGVSWIITLVLILLFIGGLLVFSRFNDVTLPLGWLFGMAALLGFIMFFIVRLLIDKFVMHKVRLVYKMIGQTKLKDGNNLNAPSNSGDLLENLDQNVYNWAKQTEDEISSLKSLEEYRRSYLGNVSHELKTPIFSIQGYLHSLIEGGLYDESINTKYLMRASANAERLESIVKDLETINKLEADPALELVKFDVCTLIKDVAEELDILAKEKNINVNFGQNPIQEIFVVADKEKIAQVVSNLLSNAINYSNQGSEVSIDFFDIEEKILIEISDNGKGIEEKHLKHLFDRFYRVDPSRSRQLGGSGLGLSIVKHILEVHKQTINVKSSVGEGTTFAFTLSKK